MRKKPRSTIAATTASGNSRWRSISGRGGGELGDKSPRPLEIVVASAPGGKRSDRARLAVF